MKTIYSIHPAIGIARLGDSGYNEETGWNGSKASYFIGPEAPGIQFVPQSYTHENKGDGYGKFRNERDKKIRRQGARFRIYRKEIDENGIVVSAKEVTSADARISWKVCLTNRKAIGERFPPYHKRFLKELTNYHYPNMVMRNYDITGDERKKLIIQDEGEIGGDNDAVVTLEGLFLDDSVKLADLLTDDRGRLIVLGGHGISKSPKNWNWGEPSILGTVRNNEALPGQLRRQGGRHRLYNWDGWCDDTSDGIVSANVVLNGDANAVPIESAWIIVAPPDHAAAVRSPVTLYDLIYSTIRKAKKQQGLPIPPLVVSFTRDVFPILRRTVDLQFASDRARLGHSGDAAGNFTEEKKIARLSSKSTDHQTEKVMFMERMTRPGTLGDRISMPDLYGGVAPDNPEKLPPSEALDNPELDRRDYFGVPITLTEYQFEVLDKWAEHDFEADWTGHEPTYPDIDAIDSAKQSAALDEAALEQCNGGSFHPGIEASFVAGRPKSFRIDAESWFRLADDVQPGALTEEMAVPWQLDFAACTELWWPGQRPVSVPKRVDEGKTVFVDWQLDFEDPESLFATLRKAGFVRIHPDSGEIYLDDSVEELMNALLETGTTEALEVREWLSRIRQEGDFPSSLRGISTDP